MKLLLVDEVNIFVYLTSTFRSEHLMLTVVVEELPAGPSGCSFLLARPWSAPIFLSEPEAFRGRFIILV